jgi:hypothetical protein
VTDRSWTHVGRVWSSGDPYLVIDATLRGGWHGTAGDRVEARVHPTSVPVGPGRAAVVAGAEASDVPSDETGGWVEVFTAGPDTVAFVRVTGGDYGELLRSALSYPAAQDESGDVIEVSSGNLAVFNAALDGAGEHGAELASARPGPAPVSRPPFDAASLPGLLLSLAVGGYRLYARRRTDLDSGCFSRWMLSPAA